MSYLEFGINHSTINEEYHRWDVEGAIPYRICVDRGRAFNEGSFAKNCILTFAHFSLHFSLHFFD